jgi:hypothetical protein
MRLVNCRNEVDIYFIYPAPNRRGRPSMIEEIYQRFGMQLLSGAYVEEEKNRKKVWGGVLGGGGGGGLAVVVDVIEMKFHASP